VILLFYTAPSWPIQSFSTAIESHREPLRGCICLCVNTTVVDRAFSLLFKEQGVENLWYITWKYSVAFVCNLLDTHLCAQFVRYLCARCLVARHRAQICARNLRCICVQFARHREPICVHNSSLRSTSVPTPAFQDLVYIDGRKFRWKSLGGITQTFWKNYAHAKCS